MIAIRALGWSSICYLYGQTNATLAILTGGKKTYAYGARALFNDTAVIADSLVFSSYGYEEIGDSQGCLRSRGLDSYREGYTSIYTPFLVRRVYPKALEEARIILKSRPANWKSELFRKIHGDSLLQSPPSFYSY